MPIDTNEVQIHRPVEDLLETSYKTITNAQRFLDTPFILRYVNDPEKMEWLGVMTGLVGTCANLIELVRRCVDQQGIK